MVHVREGRAASNSLKLFEMHVRHSSNIQNLHPFHKKGNIYQFLEQRHYKKDSNPSKIIPILNLPSFSPSLYKWGKSVASSKLESFFTEWSRSYIVLALTIMIDREVVLYCKLRE